MPDLAGRFKTLHSGCSLQCGTDSGCTDCQELGAFNMELESAEDLVRQVKTRRSCLLARVNSRRDLLTSKLPVEVVCYIFEEYIQLHLLVPEDYCIRGEVRPRFFAPIHRSGPLRLGAVCQRWRRVAWAHPRLWKTLVIAICSPGHELGPIMVDEWLSRTGEQELEIQMMNDCQDCLVPSVRMVESAISVVRAFNSVSSRWRSLDFCGCPLEILSELDDTGCATKSLLQHLGVGSHTERRRSYDAKLLEKSMHRHRPTFLSILSPIRPSQLNIEWSQLTRLYLENMSCKHCLRTLAWLTNPSPALRHLTLRLMEESNFDMPGDTYKLRCPALESLVIYEENCEPEMTNLLFGALILPALRTLKYNGDDEDNEFPTEGCLLFLNRSACSLETLEILNPCIEDNELTRLLRAVPTLRALTIRLTEDNRSASLFESFAQKHLNQQSPAAFLPNLAQLNITATAPEHWSTFIGMFADDPSVQDSEFGQRRPSRHGLQVMFKVQAGSTPREPDLRSLWQLAFLWKEYQFYVVLQLAEPHGFPVKRSNFLLWSYRIRSLAPGISFGTFKGLKEDLAVMSKLSF